MFAATEIFAWNSKNLKFLIPLESYYSCWTQRGSSLEGWKSKIAYSLILLKLFSNHLQKIKLVSVICYQFALAVITWLMELRNDGTGNIEMFYRPSHDRFSFIWHSISRDSVCIENKTIFFGSNLIRHFRCLKVFGLFESE